MLQNINLNDQLKIYNILSYLLFVSSHVSIGHNVQKGKPQPQQEEGSLWNGVLLCTETYTQASSGQVVSVSEIFTSA